MKLRNTESHRADTVKMPQKGCVSQSEGSLVDVYALGYSLTKACGSGVTRLLVRGDRIRAESSMSQLRGMKWVFKRVRRM